MVTSDEMFAVLNRLLDTATPEGAYALGIVFATCQDDGREITEAIMERAVACATLREALDLCEALKKEG